MPPREIEAASVFSWALAVEPIDACGALPVMDLNGFLTARQLETLGAEDRGIPLGGELKDRQSFRNRAGAIGGNRVLESDGNAHLAITPHFGGDAQGNRGNSGSLEPVFGV